MPAASLEVVGVLMVGPASPVVSGPVAAPSLAKNVNLGVRRNVNKHVGDSISVTGTFSLPFQGIVGATFVFIRALSGTLQLQVTSSLGATQLVPLSGMWVWDNPQGPAITALATVGDGEIEYTIAGN